MRVVILFAPAFLSFGKAFVRDLQKREPGVEIIALASTTKIHAQLLKDKTLSFLHLECLEDREREWLAAPCDPVRLKAMEESLPPQFLNDILVADRLAGAGFVTCARAIDTALTRAARGDKARAYICGLADYVRNLKQKFDPDAAFIYAVAGATSKALFDILKLEGVRTLRLQHTRIDDRYIIDTDAKGLMDGIRSRYESGGNAGQEHRSQARRWLDKFHESKGTKPGYFAVSRSRMKRRYSIQGIAKNIIRSAGRLGASVLMRGSWPLHAETGWHGFAESIRVPLQYLHTRRPGFFDEAARLEGRAYIFFPLHVDPEASTMHLAPDWTNQLCVIEALARRKPLHMDLVVKEHPNMVGRRPHGFYERIKNFPGVVFVHPEIDSAVLIRKAALVTTITGTAGWEAMLFGRPLLMFAGFPFSALLRPEHRGRYETLGHDIMTALSLPPIDEQEILRFLGLVFEESFPMSSGAFWSELDDEGAGAYADSIAQMAERFLYLAKKES